MADEDIRIEKEGATKVRVMWTCVRRSDGSKAHHVATDEYAQPRTRDEAFAMTTKNPPSCPNGCAPWSTKTKRG